MRREFGRHIVIDPEIYHGDITFRGTRIPVTSVLEDIAEGTDWDTIIEYWHGSITREVIGEAVRLACEALVARHGQAPRAEPARA